jgi:uncharacterized DUF497 family protein
MPRRNIEFEWNAKKAAINLRKHRVSFDEAETAFDDPLALIFDDEKHSETELREILIGYSNMGRLLFVSFVQRALNLIRIISARGADSQEKKDYEKAPRY